MRVVRFRMFYCFDAISSTRRQPIAQNGGAKNSTAISPYNSRISNIVYNKNTILDYGRRVLFVFELQFLCCLLAVVRRRPHMYTMLSRHFHRLVSYLVVLINNKVTVEANINPKTLTVYISN